MANLKERLKVGRRRQQSKRSRLRWQSSIRSVRGQGIGPGDSGLGESAFGLDDAFQQQPQQRATVAWDRGRQRRQTVESDFSDATAFGARDTAFDMELGVVDERG